ncbi:hypothetical protein, partial [Klebsiella pneumoniae]|uniref:hypothetical protein n=1 Tax=Klebsiella pneumoniae TaxID=573 RepID=UPI00115C7E3A
RLGCQKACVLPENPASYRVVRKKSYLFNKAANKAASLCQSDLMISSRCFITICKKPVNG